MDDTKFIEIFSKNNLNYISYEKQIKISDMSFDDLCNLEISHQECKKYNSTFNIEKFIIFDRDSSKYWPDCSIMGDELYRKGEVLLAYQMFRSINSIDIDPLAIPSWSQGIYGMSIADVEHSILDLENFFYTTLENNTNIEFCVGFNDKYLPFLKIFSKSLLSEKIIINAVYSYEKQPDNSIINEVKKLKNVNLFGIKTPENLAFRNKKGFYTLIRYLLAHIRIVSTQCNQVIVDIDSKVNNLDFLKNYQEYDIGILELNRPRRPWLKHTAPFLYISNNEKGNKFSKVLSSKCSELITLCENKKNISLWGVDQACITSTIDFFNYNKYDIKYFNFIKQIDQFLIQAQSISKDKSIFINKYL